MNILFATQFSKRDGYGHLSRCINLARSLQEENNTQIYLLNISESDFLGIKEPFSEIICLDIKFIDQILLQYQIDILIIDFNQDFDEIQLKILSSLDVTMIAIDDLTPRRLITDINFYPPIPQLSALDWKHFRGKNCIGWDYYILNKALNNISKKIRSNKKLFISFGGSDAFDLGNKISSIIPQFLKHYEIDYVVGPLASFPKELANLDDKLNLYVNPENYIEIMSKSDIAVVTYGVSVFELAYLKIPAVIISTQSDHESSGKIFWDEYSSFKHVESRSKQMNQLVFELLNELSNQEVHSFPEFKRDINREIIETIKESR